MSFQMHFSMLMMARFLDARYHLFVQVLEIPASWSERPHVRRACPPGILWNLCQRVDTLANTPYMFAFVVAFGQRRDSQIHGKSGCSAS